MKEIIFQDGGALPADSPVYIERDADDQARQHLAKMDYITLVEPRQQGKTSLINRLMGQFQLQGYWFTYADLTTFDKTNEAAWYTSLCDWLLRQMRFIPGANRPALPATGNAWRNFLADIAEQADTVPCNLVTALDEVGAVPAAWASDFFSSIRSVYNSRQNISSFHRLTFIVAGAYNPKELIRDRTISNFNVDHRVPLADFNLKQMGQLVAHLKAGINAQSVANRLWYWTGGQPYMSQRLCRYLAELNVAITPAAVDASVERFFREDTNHLSRILLQLDAEPHLRDYAQRIVTERVRLVPSVHDWQFQLCHIIGLISADENGYSQIRNRIYERALAEASDRPPQSVTGEVELAPDQDLLEPIDPLRLRRILADRFNEEELRDLCFEMHIDYESLVGQGKSGKARELVMHCERQGRIRELAGACRLRRPDAFSTKPKTIGGK
jgi:hypothetical protein